MVIGKKKSSGGGRGKGKSARGTSSSSPSPPRAGRRQQNRRRRKKNGGYLQTNDDHQFRHSLESDGRWAIMEMEADGNCLFRSLSDQMYGDFGNDHVQVRSEVCDYIQAHEEEFCVFLVLDEDEEDEDAADFKSYVRNMRDDGEWGGNLELVAASRLFRCNVTVFQANQSALTISCNGDSCNSNKTSNKTNPDLFLSYHDNGHYNSVRDNQAAGKSSKAFDRAHQTKVNDNDDDDDDDYNYEHEKKGRSTAKATNNSRTRTTQKTQRRPNSNKRKNDEKHSQQQRQEEQQQQQQQQDQQRQQNDATSKTSTESAHPSTITVKKKVPLPKKSSVCPCGSGARYRKCCWEKDRNSLRSPKLNRNGNNSGKDDPDEANQQYEMNGNFRVLMI